MAIDTLTDENPDFDALMTFEQVNKGERNNQEMGVNRRTMLLVLTSSRKDLIEKFLTADDEANETYFEVLDGLSEYHEHLKLLVQFCEAAQARMLIAGHVWSEQRLR